MSPRRAAVLRHAGGPHVHIRDHLVVSVDELLAREPIHALTTRAIAEHAGVADGVLYNHFADKSDLVIAALVRRFGRLVERLEASAPEAGEGTVTANVQAFGRSLARMNAESMGMAAGLLADPALLHRFWAKIHRTPFGIERLRRPLAGYLAAERDLGRRRPGLLQLPGRRSVQRLCRAAVVEQPVRGRIQQPGLRPAGVRGDRAADRQPQRVLIHAGAERSARHRAVPVRQAGLRQLTRWPVGRPGAALLPVALRQLGHEAVRVVERTEAAGVRGEQLLGDLPDAAARPHPVEHLQRLGPRG